MVCLYMVMVCPVGGVARGGGRAFSPLLSNFPVCPRAVCQWNGENNMANESLKVATYVAECKKNEKVVNALDVLNSYRKELLEECKDEEVVNAKIALDKARERYNKLATEYVLNNSLYCDLQTECVRTAVRSYSVAHNIKRFFEWFDTNEKDVQTSIIDSVQRLGSKLADLHKSFASGSKVARKKKASISSLEDQIAELQRQLKEAKGE